MDRRAPTIVQNGQNEGYYDLADYGSGQITTAYARTTGNQYVGYSDANNNQIDMVNGQGNLLSTVTPVDASTMNFEWHAFH